MALRFVDFVLDLEQRVLSRGNLRVELSPRAFKLLEVLIAERPRALKKRELMDRIWPDVVVQEANLKTAVSQLRTALGAPDLIRTVHRYGYAFAGEVISDVPYARPYRLLGEGMRISLFRPVAIIGRHQGCDVCIDSPDISRHHARITARPDAIVIEDLGSKNGTWVGLERVDEPRELRDGDRIRVADVTLIFRAGSGDSTTASRADTPQ